MRKRTVAAVVPLAVALAALTWGLGQAGAQQSAQERKQAAREALEAVTEAHAASSPLFQKYLDEAAKAKAGAAMKAARPGSLKAPAAGPQRAVFPHVYPWPHNPIPNPAMGFNPAVDYDVPNYSQSPNIRKFVDSLPGLTYANRNNLNQYIPVAVPTTTGIYAGSEFYDITTKQYSVKMHTDLPATSLRGYAQVAGVGPGQTNAANVGGVNQYLGPLILARVFDPTRAPGVVDAKGTNGKPVRLLFRNELPASSTNPLGTTPELLGRTLALPLDMTIMGAGMGPTTGQNYTDNRVSIPHLHGGRTPWISDGTPHQWTTPATDSAAAYRKGASLVNVPDMVGAGKAIPAPSLTDGLATLFWSNQQSGRLMFYHDHAYGITRLNVYAGVAAGYLLVDQVEDDLIDGSNFSHVFDNVPGGARQILPNLGVYGVNYEIYKYGIPLVIQDKSFVCDDTTPPGAGFPGSSDQLAQVPYHSSFKTLDVDPLWASYVGTTGGNLWMSHEYMPVENIFDRTGGTVADPAGGTFSWSAGNTTNGRWDYGAFMVPPMLPTNLTLPSPTITPEALCDTAVVNGTAFPYIELPPDAIRFRILSAGNDRVLNLSLFRAEPLTLRITNGGSGYTGGATPVIDPPPGFPGAGLVQATATCTVVNGVVTGITVTNPGAGYALTPAAPPAVVINPTVPGQGAGATAYACVATEVKMVDAAPNADFPSWPRDGRDGGVPDPLTAGPDWILIGNEGGFLAQAAVVPPQPVDYNYVRQVIPWLGVVSNSLLLLPAQRADVVVNFTPYQDGDVFILYNDAPAPMPGFWPYNDYYTDNPDLRMLGGGPPTAPGFGPNTRTVMQIRIKGTKASQFTFDLAGIQAAIPKAFAAENEPPIVSQLAYNDAFPGIATSDNYLQTQDETVNLTGAATFVSKVRTILPGTGYATPPTVTLIDGGGSGAAASAGLNPIGGITLLTTGSGYTSAPTVTIGPPALPLTPANLPVGGVVQGVRATAVATVSGGQVQAISIMEPGAGYTNLVTPPTITITGGGGTGATASVMLPTLGTVGSIVVTNGGGGYTSQPMAYLTGGGGMGASAIAQINGSVAMTDKMITEGFDPDYARIYTVLGSIPNPLTPNVGAGMVIGLARYIDPPTEIVNNGEKTIWRIGHLGVDSHALHFHLFDVQVINRVDWTNVVKPPYPDELGWRETIRTNPMEDIFVAFRPHAPVLPFQIPHSNRLLDPTTPQGSTTNFLPIAPPIGVPAVAQVSNVMTDFLWEYVWHCHMLSHEENDFMRPLSMNVPVPLTPTNLVAGLTPPTNVILTWACADPTQDDDYFTIQRATNSAFTSGLTTWTTTGWALTFTDTTNALNTRYYYRVRCSNAAGNSPWSNVVNLTTPRGPIPAAPSLLTGVAGAVGSRSVILNWTDNANNETGFVIQYARNNTFTSGLNTVNVNTVNLQTRTITGLRRGRSYYFRVAARNANGNSAWSNTVGPIATP